MGQASAGHTAVTSRGTRLGAAALGFGGVVFGLIQVLERSISAFQPRPGVSLLIAVTIGLAGLTLERLRHRSREVRILRRLLRVWPLRRLADTEPLALGVFPPDSPPLGPYVNRDEDAAVDEALRRGGLIVVVGPERAGKSRTVHEAAMRTAAERPVVVPLGGAALSELLADDAFTPPADSIWWLDDLARFLDHLNGPELGALLDGRTVVTTVREETWLELLRGSGDSGERGRRLIAAAQVIHLRAAPPAVLPAAPALSASPQPPSRRSDDVVFGRERDPALFAGGFATAVAAAALALTITSDNFSENNPPPIGDQIDRIRQRADREGKPTVLAFTENLHGVDRRSHVFVMRPERGGSDELRVYDEVDGWVRPRFRFQPRTQGKGYGSSVLLPDQQEKGLLDYALGEPHVIDVDGDGDREVFMNYFMTSSLLRFRLPVVLAWDEGGGGYKLSPLLVAPPAPPDEEDAVLIDYFLGSYKLEHPGKSAMRVAAISSHVVLPGTGRDSALLVAGTEGVDAKTRRRGVLAMALYRLQLDKGRALAVRQCMRPGFEPRLVEASSALNADYRPTLRRYAPVMVRAIRGDPGKAQRCSG